MSGISGAIDLALPTMAVNPNYYYCPLKSYIINNFKHDFNDGDGWALS